MIDKTQTTGQIWTNTPTAAAVSSSREAMLAGAAGVTGVGGATSVGMPFAAMLADFVKLFGAVGNTQTAKAGVPDISRFPARTMAPKEDRTLENPAHGAQVRQKSVSKDAKPLKSPSDAAGDESESVQEGPVIEPPTDAKPIQPAPTPSVQETVSADHAETVPATLLKYSPRAAADEQATSGQEIATSPTGDDVPVDADQTPLTTEDQNASSRFQSGMESDGPGFAPLPSCKQPVIESPKMPPQQLQQESQSKLTVDDNTNDGEPIQQSPLKLTVDGNAKDSAPVRPTQEAASDESVQAAPQVTVDDFQTGQPVRAENTRFAEISMQLQVTSQADAEADAALKIQNLDQGASSRTEMQFAPVSVRVQVESLTAPSAASSSAAVEAVVPTADANGSSGAQSTLNKAFNAADFEKPQLTRQESAANRTDFVEKLVKTSQLAVKSGQAHVKMLLQPEQLGPLRVDIWLKEGVLNGSMQVETHAARHLMNSHMNELKQSLEQQGIHVGSFNIMLSQGEQQAREMPFQSYFSDGSGITQSSADTDEVSRVDLVGERARLLRGRHRLDLVA